MIALTFAEMAPRNRPSNKINRTEVLLSGEEAKAAYDRLAAGRFRDHKCEAETSLSAAKQRDADTAFAERARVLIKRGYKPTAAVELVLQEIEFEHSSGTRLIERARADAEDFLLRVRKGLIRSGSVVPLLR
jgi:hypothetical protein